MATNLSLRDPTQPNSADNPYLFSTIEEIANELVKDDAIYDYIYYEFDPTTFETNYQKWKNNQASYKGEVIIKSDNTKEYVIDFNKTDYIINGLIFRWTDRITVDFKDLIIKNIYTERRYFFNQVRLSGYIDQDNTIYGYSKFKNLSLLNCYINNPSISYTYSHLTSFLLPVANFTNCKFSVITNATPNNAFCLCYMEKTKQNFFGCSFNVRTINKNVLIMTTGGDRDNYNSEQVPNFKNCNFRIDSYLIGSTKYLINYGVYKNCKFTGNIIEKVDGSGHDSFLGYYYIYNSIIDFNIRNIGTGTGYTTVSAQTTTLLTTDKNDNRIRPSGDNIVKCTREQLTDRTFLIQNGFPIMYESDETDDIFGDIT